MQETKAPVSSQREADFYLEEGRVVFTAAYHKRRGACCHNGCRHCPYGNASADKPATGQ